jgi:hypothetical protein
MIERHPKLGILGIVIAFGLIGFVFHHASGPPPKPFTCCGTSYGPGGGAASVAVVAGGARAVKGTVGGVVHMGGRVMIYGGLRGALRGSYGRGFGSGFGGGLNGYSWSP